MTQLDVIRGSSGGIPPRRMQRLVAAAARRDREALDRLTPILIEAITREARCALRGHAARMGTDAEQDLRDAVQDVFVSMLEHDARELRRWDPDRGRSFTSFVRLLTRRRISRCHRRCIRAARVDVAGQSFAVEPSDDNAEARRMVVRETLSRWLSDIVASDRPRDRRLFELVFVLEAPPAEVARDLGMTPAAVNAWVYRLRKTLRRADRPQSSNRTRAA